MPMLPESEPLEHGPSDELLNASDSDAEHSVFPRTVRLTLQILPNATRSLKFPHNARILAGRADDESQYICDGSRVPAGGVFRINA